MLREKRSSMILYWWEALDRHTFSLCQIYPVSIFTILHILASALNRLPKSRRAISRIARNRRVSPLASNVELIYHGNVQNDYVYSAKMLSLYRFRYSSYVIS